MISSETMQQRQEDIDFRREQDVKALKVQWFNYLPEKRVNLTCAYPEIAEQILILIEGVK